MSLRPCLDIWDSVSKQANKGVNNLQQTARPSHMLSLPTLCSAQKKWNNRTVSWTNNSFYVPCALRVHDYFLFSPIDCRNNFKPKHSLGPRCKACITASLLTIFNMKTQELTNIFSYFNLQEIFFLTFFFGTIPFFCHNESWFYFLLLLPLPILPYFPSHQDLIPFSCSLEKQTRY